MGRVFFFIGEGLRALRRSAAPGLASIVTVCITVLLLVFKCEASNRDDQ